MCTHLNENVCVTARHVLIGFQQRSKWLNIIKIFDWKPMLNKNRKIPCIELSSRGDASYCALNMQISGLNFCRAWKRNKLSLHLDHLGLSFFFVFLEIFWVLALFYWNQQYKEKLFEIHVHTEKSEVNENWV